MPMASLIGLVEGLVQRGYRIVALKDWLASPSAHPRIGDNRRRRLARDRLGASLPAGIRDGRSCILPTSLSVDVDAIDDADDSSVDR